MGENELYCHFANGRPVRMAKDLQNLPGIGHVRTVNAYWCRLNQAYVVYGSHKAGKLEVRKRAGRAGDICTFKVRLTSIGIGGYYGNQFLGDIYDKDYLLRFIPEHVVLGIDVWVRYWAHNAHAKFVIDALEVDKDMQLERIIRDQRPFEGHGLVMSTRGDVFVKELAQARCRLLSYFLNKFHVGQWIALRALPMASGNGYWVVSAQRFPARRIVEFPTLDTARMPNGELALRATGMTKWPKNDFIFYSQLMGIVEADTSEFADFVRFIRPVGMPQILDLWVVENESPLAQTRFKAYSVKAPGPIVQVFASGIGSLSDANADWEITDEQLEDVPLGQRLAQRRAPLPHEQLQRVHTPLPVATRAPGDDIYVHWMGRLHRNVVSQGLSPRSDNAETPPRSDNAEPERRR
ncbi:hypothetical protein AAVH_01158 [Aphelenchoides avenae]|nr:hypothetical protein AAVH_01158 [Aphelenchus avenae]